MKRIIILNFLISYISAAEINQQKLLELDKQNKAIFAEVKNYTDELLTSLKKKENIINKKLDKWSKDFDSVDSKEINKAMKDAHSVFKEGLAPSEIGDEFEEELELALSYYSIDTWKTA